MTIVDVDDVRLKGPDGTAQVPPGARVEADVPGGAEHLDAIGCRALRELTSLFCDECQRDVALACQLLTQ